MYHSSKDNYSDRVIHREYYPHIDGIRALAVMPVVLFHILATLCPGGFVGVDVFFVISGYLITGGILRDLAKDRFSIRNFYYRRVRRIMPAYFAMITGVFAFGCAFYYAQPLIFLGESVAAGTLFLANIHFWMLEGDYFSAQLHKQPLLHLWSLSVEEQFYLFIPLLCAIIWKLRRSLVAPMLALLAVLSLSFAIYAVKNGQQNNAFYFLHYRAWELLAGSLLAMLPAVAFQNIENIPARGNTEKLANTRSWKTLATLGSIPTLLATLGLLMVGLTAVGISYRTPFPGLAAVPPVLGAALLIRYGQSGWVSRFLSCRLLVMIGKISYSLYLWHWPVTVFWKYVVYDQRNIFDYIGMFVVSLMLGYLSWRFIESPVRTAAFWTMRRSFAFTASGIIILVALGAACVHQRGWPSTLHPRANVLAGHPRHPLNAIQMQIGQGILQRIDFLAGSNLYQYSIQERRNAALTEGWSASLAIGAQGEPRVLLIGDSHAGVLQYGLDISLRKINLAGYAINCSGKDLFDRQLPETQGVLRKLNDMPQCSIVILVERWLRKEWNNPRDVALTCAKIEDFSDYLKTKNKILFIVTDIPNYQYPLNEIAARMQIIKPRRVEPGWIKMEQSEELYNRTQGLPINQALDKICKQMGSKLIPLHLFLKEDNHYIFFDKQNGKTIPLYRDADHLSQAGSLRAAQFMMPYLFPNAVLKN